MKRPLLAVALPYFGGLLLGDVFPLPLAWLFPLSLGLLVPTLASARARAALLWPLVALAGWTNLTTRTAVISPHDLRIILGNQVELATLRGTLVETPTERVYASGAQTTQRTLAKIDVTALRRNHAELWVPAYGRLAVGTPGILGTDYFAGQTVEVTGVVRPPRGPVAEGLFDYRSYLRRLGIHYELHAESSNDWQVIQANHRPRNRPLADRFRAWAKNTLERG